MSIKYSNPRTPLSEAIDRAYEMAGLARMDGDKADEARWLKEVERLRKQGHPD